ncbi:MAG: hypothetical protein EP332_07835 [Bacteroidetes bacterium]|nr:MAG: hypothetical protein EP332_07835 [Bacteroidota bacterium]
MQKQIAFFLLLFIPFSSQAQNLWSKPLYSPLKTQKEALAKAFDVDKISYGGNFGLNLGTVTVFDISPWVGYRVLPQVTPGVGLSYMYYRDNFTATPYSTNLFAARAFLRIDVAGPIFVYGELEALNYDHYDRFTFERKRIWFNSPIIGVGYKQMTGDESAFMVSILYALRSEEELSPYFQSPLIYRIGYMFR